MMPFSSPSLFSEFSSSSSSPLVVTREEFNAFHKIDRTLFTRFVYGLHRDINQTFHVIAFLLMLEQNGYARNVISYLVASPDTFIDAVANEIGVCLSFLYNQNFFGGNSVDEESFIPLVICMTGRKLTLGSIHQNRETFLLAVANNLRNVCDRAFEDLTTNAERYHRESLLALERERVLEDLRNIRLSAQQGTTTTRPRVQPVTIAPPRSSSSSSRTPPPLLSSPSPSSLPPLPPVPATPAPPAHASPLRPAHASPPRAPAHASPVRPAHASPPRAPAPPAHASPLRPAPASPPRAPAPPAHASPLLPAHASPPRAPAPPAHVVEETNKTSPAKEKEEEKVIVADDRTVFLTFSKGYPISEEQVRVHFTRLFGDIIEAILMQEVEDNEQPLYARMVLKMQYALKMGEIVSGRNRNKFTIDGKHVWARKYVPKNPTSASSSSYY